MTQSNDACVQCWALKCGCVTWFLSAQVEVDYQGGGTYKRKYRVREIIPKGPFDITFKNEQVGFDHYFLLMT